MKKSRVSTFAWGLCALVSVGAIASPFISYAQSGTQVIPVKIITGIVSGIFITISMIIAVVILVNQPRNMVGWLMLAFSVPIGLIVPIQAFFANMIAKSAPGSLWDLVLTWFGGWSWWLLIGPLLLIPLYFPEGRLPSKRWRWVSIVLFASFLLFLFFGTFVRVLTDVNTERQIFNPIGFLDDNAITLLVIPVQAGLIISTIGSIASVFYRYRRGSPIEREQIKWLLYAGTIFLVVYSLGFFVNQSSQDNYWAVLFNVVCIGIPLAIGVAIMRYRLWDIDIIIRRTLSYSVLSLLLGGLYFGLVTALQALIAAITGERSTLAILVTTLLLAWLFNPLRVRIQVAIDQRFYRRKYNSQQAIQAFVASARNQTDLEALSEELVRVTHETLQPSSISLWLQEPLHKLTSLDHGSFINNSSK